MSSKISFSESLPHCYELGKYINILDEGDTLTCLRALTAGYIPIMCELLHAVDASGEPGTPES